MATEHLNEYGQLCQGYYCMRCGEATGMYGHMNHGCTPNPTLVNRLVGINQAGSLEKYTFNLLKETDDG